jgi:pimeloyl-ACP methyl ester carboxylesterase
MPAQHRPSPAAPQPLARRWRCIARRWAAACAAALAGAVAGPGLAADTTSSAQPATCPKGVAAGSRCLAGRDSAGAHYWLAMPPQWSGTLVVHAHGGPELGEPKAERPLADLERWAVWTRAGHAYAGSGFRQGGVAVRSAAEDTERVRRLFIAEFGAPKRTVLHGQSWGAGVAAVAAEMYASSWDAVLLTSGVLGGGTQSYPFRLDLRVVYQALCGNHPAPGEPVYPLWQGLPEGSKLTRPELAARVDACTGVGRKPAERTAAQQRVLDDITRVIRIPESALMGHMNWSTWHFQDIALRRTGGGNSFGNEGVRYSGSSDDEALNARVLRYRADPQAVAIFGADTDPQGRIGVPVLSVHGVHDAVAFVELESHFRQTMERGGSAQRLVQAFTDDAEHSYTRDAQYVAAIDALLEWQRGGPKPTPAAIDARCRGLDAAWSPAQACRFLPQYTPAPLAQRVPPR